MGQKLWGTAVCFTCDKGKRPQKRNWLFCGELSVRAVAERWNVHTLLDMSVVKRTGKGCTDAIAHSMEKLLWVVTKLEEQIADIGSRKIFRVVSKLSASIGLEVLLCSIASCSSHGT